MRQLFKRYGKTIAIITIAIISFALLVTAITMLAQYSDEVADRSISKAQYYTFNAKQNVTDSLNDYTAKSIVAANAVSECTDETEILTYFIHLAGKSGFEDVLFARYFRDGVLYAENGDEYTGVDAARKYYEKHPDKAGYIGTFEDDTTVEGRMSVIGFYAPVAGSEIADGVVLYYTRNYVKNFFPSKNENPNAEFSVLVTNSGEIIVGQEQVESSQLYTVLREKIGRKASVDEVETIITSGQDGTARVRINSVDYIVSVGADERIGDLAVVELYRVNVLCSDSFEFVHTIIAVIILFAIITIFVIIYMVIRRINREREFFNLEVTDKKLDCLNRHGFEKEVKKIFERNKVSYFAVVAIQLRHYKFILENYGEGETGHLLAYLRMTCSKTVGLEEAFGHNGNGQFLLLMHAKDRAALIERLKIHSFLATQYRGANKFDVLLRYGIYEVDHSENVTVPQMIDFANEANNTVNRTADENAGMPFNFYNDDLRKIRMINEDMELRMEGALQAGEFQVFYQAKYNLNLGKQDGCEALVRWYDIQTKQYNRPALFMPLFESNGFVVKLDKYVYTKVCEYISYSIAQGRTVFPVSVNVSRITAVQPDFIDFFVQTKKKYGIADGQIMVEFTESFAYENYETLRSIVDNLHKHGFKCSIDDFGCGYSSYKILKTLSMDEIKLDKFFLDKGDSTERDQIIFESIIRLGKSLGMKVTQEGVETQEDVQRLIGLGCNVIQGYIYSHPLPLSDYLAFVASSKEHNLT